MRACPICSRGTHSVFLGQVIKKIYMALPDQYAGTLPVKFDVVKCARCGIVYNDIDVSDEQLRTYYSAPSYKPTRPYRNEQARLLNVADRIVKQVPAGSTIFEVGYESGTLGQMLKLDYEYEWGQQPSKRYDLIVVNQVLEHILRPREFLYELRPFTDLFYIDVPSGEDEERLYNFEHMQHFKPEHLRAICDETINWDFYTWHVGPYSTFVNTLWGFFPSYRRCYVRGFGHKAYQRIAFLEDNFGTEIVGVIDQDPRDLTFEGKHVMHPGEPLEAGVPVCICVDSRLMEIEIRGEYADRLLFT